MTKVKLKKYKFKYWVRQIDSEGHAKSGYAIPNMQ